MGYNKKTAKGRLDKYYYLAKEQGYRARSAFKLKQLNQKFKFLDKARVLVDLCAAPGGWLQVASECMPLSKLIIGVDLVPIKPIKGVTTLVNDITTESCRAEVKNELKGWKVDVVVHDGAPNVGNAWVQDAFSQAELALHSFKLASELLNDGGSFVTKIFRSKEFPLVVSSLRNYFKKVDVTKPDSSRSVSAEIFAVCKGFNHEYSRLHPVCVKDILSSGNEASLPLQTSIINPHKKKVNREGYEDNVTLLHKTLTLNEYLNSDDPERILSEYNQILASNHDERKFLEAFKDGQEIEQYCGDLKVIGKKEFKILLKLHKTFHTSLRSDRALEPEINEGPSSESIPSTLLSIKAIKRSQKKKEWRLSRTLRDIGDHADVGLDQLHTDDHLLNDSGWMSSAPVQDLIKELSNNIVEEDEVVVRKDASTISHNIELRDAPNPATGSAHMDPDELADLSYNRFAFNDDPGNLPKWFVDDENQHNVPQTPITKEVADMLRAHERLVEDRLPKKVMEAKNRMKVRALRRLQSMRKKASVIAEDCDIGDGQKLTQIRKLLAKAKVSRPKASIVIAKGKLKGQKGRPKGVKGKYKMVDRRMLKDIRGKPTKK